MFVACRSQAELRQLISSHAVGCLTLICQSNCLMTPVSPACCLLFAACSLLPPVVPLSQCSLPLCLCLVLSVVIAHRISVIVFSSSSFSSFLFAYSFQLNWWWIMLHGVAYWLTDGCKRRRGAFSMKRAQTACCRYLWSFYRSKANILY